MVPDAVPAPETRHVERTAVLVVATLASFLTPFMSSAISVALPAIGAEMSLDTIMLSWVPLVFLLAAAVFLIPCGRLADMYGLRRIFLYGIAAFTLASLGCTLAPSAPWLIGLRGLQGVGGAMIFGTGLAMLTSVYPPAGRGRVLGINVAAVYLGLSLGPFLGGLLTQWAGWRSLFVVPVLLGGLIIGITLVALKHEERGRAGMRFDLRGAAGYGVSLVALMYGLSVLPSARGAWLLAFGTAALVGFLWWEGRVAYPIFNVQLFRGNTVFAFSNLAALINYCATSAVTFLLSLYLQYVKGLDPRHAGIVLVAQPVMMTLVSPAAGRLSDRIEPRILASIGMGLSAAGLLLFAFLTPETPIGWIVAGLLVLGVGFGLFSSPNTNAVMGSVGRESLGVASATLGTMRLTGQMLSLGLAMVFFALIVGRVRISPELLPEFLRAVRLTFSFCAALCVGGVFASLARGNALTSRQ